MASASVSGASSGATSQQLYSPAVRSQASFTGRLENEMSQPRVELFTTDSLFQLYA